MLRRLKPSSFPFLSRPIHPLIPSPFSKSNPNPNTLKTLTKTIPQSSKSKNNPTSNPQTLAPNSQFSLINSDAESILSLLSDPSPDLDNLLKEFKPKLTSDLTLEILKNYKRLGRSKTLDFFSWAGSQLRFQFDDHVVEYMADFLGRRKLFDDLKCLLRTVSLIRGRISARTVAISIRFLGRQGRVSEALSLFEMMQLEFNCNPDNMVFNNVLYILCKRNLPCEFDSIDTALAIFRRIGQPDNYSFSNIIVGLCRSGRLESAFEVFGQMGRANLVPTRSAANVLVGKLCELAGKSEKVGNVKVTNVRRAFEILVPNLGVKSSIEPAVKVFWAILKSDVLPSAHVVRGLISELCRMEKFDEAIEIVKVVESRKMRWIGESYTIVVRALCEVHRVNEACDLFDRMMFLGLKPKLIVYNSIIREFCKSENVEEAMRYFKIMNKRRCDPDCATYTMLIHAYCLMENWEAAYGLLMEMIEFGWHPHLDIYNSVNSLLDKNGRSDLSVRLERKMETQNLLAHCKAGRLEAACDKLCSMLAKGFHLPIYARDSFERTFWKSGRWKVARELLEQMDQNAAPNNVQA